jgi:hypothetical protein
MIPRDTTAAMITVSMKIAMLHTLSPIRRAYKADGAVVKFQTET